MLEVSGTLLCPVCLRREQWDGGQRQVLSVGGARSPAEPFTLAVWRILLASRRGECGAIAGPCGACGIPMVVEHGTAPAWTEPWRLSTPVGEIEVGDQITGPDGELTEGEASALLEHSLRRPINWFQQAFSTVSVGLMVVIVACWVFAASFVSFFLFGGAGLLR